MSLRRAISILPPSQSILLAPLSVQVFSTVPNESNEGPVVLYQAGLKSGKYRPDARQATTISKLQALYERLGATMPRRQGSGGGLTIVESVQQSPEPSTSWWQRLVGTEEDSAADQAAIAADDDDSSTHPHHHHHHHHHHARGLYMYGGVGCGKTMLMDLLLHASPPHYKARRVHFHDFMLDIHRRLRRLGKEKKDVADPLKYIAREYANECRVLCLDEVMVTDVADAMILNRLFAGLWRHGLVLVATSNRRPDDLYENGLQRALFLPFIENLKKHCEVHDMASGTDYRKLAQFTKGLWFTGPHADAILQERFNDLAQGHAVENASIEIMMGRQLTVPRASLPEGVCWFSFDELCNRPVGASDYIGLVSKFHTLCLAHVPIITLTHRSAAHRFVTLIDLLYEHRVRLIVSAEASILNLFQHVVTSKEFKEKGVGDVVDDVLGFAKDRAMSRLTEMSSHEYLRAHATVHAPGLLPALHEDETKAKANFYGI